MNDKTREDLSLLCGRKYNENWVKTHIEGSMSPDEFDAWLDKYCIRCVRLPEVCCKEE